SLSKVPVDRNRLRAELVTVARNCEAAVAKLENRLSGYRAELGMKHDVVNLLKAEQITLKIVLDAIRSQVGSPQERVPAGLPKARSGPVFLPLDPDERAKFLSVEVVKKIPQQRHENVEWKRDWKRSVGRP